MFIRKRKILNEINAMIEDCLYWEKLYHSRNDGQSASTFTSSIIELKDLRYFILNNKRCRELKRRERGEY